MFEGCCASLMIIGTVFSFLIHVFNRLVGISNDSFQADLFFKKGSDS